MKPSQILESLLFVAGEPVDRRTLEKVLALSREEFALVISDLEIILSNTGLALIITEDTLELRAKGECYEAIKTFRELELSEDLGRASLETLSIILYRNGATRKDIDWIRGVNSTTSVRTLLLRGLIEKTDYDADKRLSFYKATSEGLAHLGVTRAEDLPRYEELSKELLSRAHMQTDPS